jgi:predicted Fe-S protein YdhL (DUF1289 family)
MKLLVWLKNQSLVFGWLGKEQNLMIRDKRNLTVFQDHKMSVVVVLKPINRADVLRDVDPCSSPRHPTNSLTEGFCKGCVNVHGDVHVWTYFEVTQITQGQTVNRCGRTHQKSMGWNVVEQRSVLEKNLERWIMSLVRRHCKYCTWLCLALEGWVHVIEKL